MAKKTSTSKVILLEPYRSKLEERIGSQLSTAGFPFNYESEKLEYTVPERHSKYIPDFILTKKDGTKMYIEAKGRFGANRFGKTVGNPTEQRQKLILVKEQHPTVDLRIVFDKASIPIYKGSPTTYAKWAQSHGFPWADGGVIPPSWIKELKHD